MWLLGDVESIINATSLGTVVEMGVKLSDENFLFQIHVVVWSHCWGFLI